MENQAQKLWRFVAATFREAPRYGGLSSSFRLLPARLGTTAPGRRIFGSRTKKIEFEGTPVTFRTGTSDFLVIEEVLEHEVYKQAAPWATQKPVNIIDLGANIGIATLYLQKLFPNGCWTLVEPDAGNFKVLSENMSRMKPGCLQLHQAFVAAKEGSASLDRSGEAWAFRKTNAPSSAADAIPCLSMPALIDGSDVHLLKCDIEGSEEEVFENCSPWILKIRHLIVETHQPYSLLRLYQDLRKGGWDFSITHESPGDSVSQCFLTRRH